MPHSGLPPEVVAVTLELEIEAIREMADLSRLTGGRYKVKPKIAIACQGGGRRTAFTAGDLHALFEPGSACKGELLERMGVRTGFSAPARQTRRRAAIARRMSRPQPKGMMPG
jgi:hypothetical protein